MLEDRTYMKESFIPKDKGKSPVIVLLVICVVIFILNYFGIYVLFEKLFGMNAVQPGNNPNLINIFELTALPVDWQIQSIFRWVTAYFAYMFLHADEFHIIFNMIGLFMFGRLLEMQMENRAIYRLFIGSGLIAGISFVAVELVSQHFGGHPSSVVGASGAVFAFIIAVLLIMPNQEVSLLFFRLKLKWVAIVYILLSFLSILDPDSQVSHSAHIGGLIGGYLIIRLFHKDMIRFKFNDIFQHFKAKKGTAISSKKRHKPQKQSGFGFEPPDLKLLDDNEELERDPMLDIDPILDKIGKHGLKSLTKEERRVLDKAKDKLDF